MREARRPSVVNVKEARCFDRRLGPVPMERTALRLGTKIFIPIYFFLTSTKTYHSPCATPLSKKSYRTLAITYAQVRAVCSPDNTKEIINRLLLYSKK